MKKVFLFVGPRAIGGTYWIKEFTWHHYKHLFYEVKSVTTRNPRSHEPGDTARYQFVSKEKFKEMIDANEFLEWDEYRGEHYGTSINNLCEALEKKYALMKITHNGAAALKEKGMMLGIDVRIVFLIPHNDNVLLKNLARRYFKTGIPEKNSKELTIARDYLQEMKRIITPDARIFLKGENTDFVSFFKLFYKNGVLVKPHSSI